MRFKIGNIPWNKGLKMTEELKIKMYCTRVLRTIRYEEIMFLYKQRKKNKHLYPFKYNENIILNLKL